jgi:hypothetical protein
MKTTFVAVALCAMPNCSARAENPSCFDSSAMKPGMAVHARAAWFFTGAMRFGLANS